MQFGSFLYSTVPEPVDGHRIRANCREFRNSYLLVRAICHIDKWFFFYVFTQLVLSTFQQFNNWRNMKNNKYINI